MEDPSCMTEDELESWREQAAYVRTNFNKGSTADPCSDCLIAFSQEMRSIGLCNGIPGEARVSVVPRSRAELRRESNRRSAQRFRESRRALAGGLG